MAQDAEIKQACNATVKDICLINVYIQYTQKINKIVQTEHKSVLNSNSSLSTKWKVTVLFSHITQHSIQNITKQNNRHILNISRSNQKGGREGRTTRTQKLLLHTITYIHQKTLPSINGRRLGPTNSCRCTFTWHYLQEATDPMFFYTCVV